MKMKTILCTLYNSLYLDKGLVLYESLCECSKEFKLYVLCMDDKCYDVISSLNQPNHIPISLSDFEKDDGELQKAKISRSFGEYCWTCTPSLINFVIKKYNEDICTYLDADLCFYQDPQLLIDEMLDAGKSVLIVPHRFTEVNKVMEKNGIYCVEFNTFVNKEDSMTILERWRNDCLSCCTSENDGTHFGDQKYLDDWPERYECVHVCSNMGAGVAPWNIQTYKLYSSNNNKIVLKIKNTKNIVDLTFYHFQNIEYLDDKIVKINVYSQKYNNHYQLVKKLYKEYLYRIEEKKKYLRDNYCIDIKLRSHPAFTKKNEKKDIVDAVRKMTIKKITTKLLVLYNREKDYFKL